VNSRENRPVTQPSIKGTAFASAVADLQELVDRGRLTREQLEVRLRREDIEIIDAKILPGDWYPIESYGRILELLGHVAGGGASYHLQRGRRTAERLLSSGIYKQFDRAVGQREEKNEAALVSIMLTVGRTLYNFGSWEMLRDGGSRRRMRFELREMKDLPENARITIQGFVEWAAEHIMGREIKVESKRTQPDRIQFDLFIG
jgi:hypothetical protein